jgi:hypothetical protein
MRIMADDSTIRKKYNSIPDVQAIYPYPGQTKSKVWEYFGFLKIKEGPPTKHNLHLSPLKEYSVCVVR